jgi:hypothetical protein
LKSMGLNGPLEMGLLSSVYFFASKKTTKEIAFFILPSCKNHQMEIDGP